MEARDNSIHESLKNWGAHQNKEFIAGPREHPNGSSWHGQVTNRQDANFPDVPLYIDNEAAERVQTSMLMCRDNDLETYWILAWFYRDGWSVSGLRRARNRLWRWL